ncbi:MAG: DUF2079 domain-containing protein [Nitrospinota bacterium]|nr:DUF2079 domain-containing protein [Nitrospinota bacterium]
MSTDDPGEMNQEGGESSVKGFMRSHWAEAAVTLLSVLYTGWFFHLSMDRFNSLFCVLDFIHIDSACYFTAHGKFMWSNALMSNFFEHHASLILLVVSAFYLVSDSHWFILFFQAASAGMAAIPLFYFARGALKSDLAALFVAAAYLANGEIHRGILFDYHMYAHFPLFTFATAAALQAGKNRQAVLFAALLLATKEDAFITLAGLGLYAAVILHDLKRAGAIWLGCAAWACLVFLVIYPLQGAPSPESVEIGVTPAGVKMETGGFKYGGRYAWLGGSPTQIVKGFVTEPGQTIGKLFEEPRRIHAWSRLSVGFLLLPFFSLTGFLILFWPSMELFLSDYEMSYLLSGHYPMLPLSTWFLAAVLGVANIKRLAAWVGNAGLGMALATAACGAFFAAQLFFSTSSGALPLTHEYPNEVTPRAREHGARGRAVISQIPKDATLAAHPGPFSHLNHNPNAYLFVKIDRFPFTRMSVEYVVLDGKDPYKFAYREFQADDHKKMLLHGEYGLVAEDDHVYVFQKSADKKPDWRLFMKRFATFSGRGLIYNPHAAELSSPEISLAPGEYQAEYVIDIAALCRKGGGEYFARVGGQMGASRPLDCSVAREHEETAITLPFTVAGETAQQVSLGMTGDGFAKGTVFRIDMSYPTFMDNVRRPKL